MPITRSARKALRTSAKKRNFNLARKDKVSKAVKAVKSLVAAGKSKEARAALSVAQAALDKAAKTHAIDKNTASRRKSRLSKMVKRIK